MLERELPLPAKLVSTNYSNPDRPAFIPATGSKPTRSAGTRDKAQVKSKPNINPERPPQYESLPSLNITATDPVSCSQPHDLMWEQDDWSLLPKIVYMPSISSSDFPSLLSTIIHRTSQWSITSLPNSSRTRQCDMGYDYLFICFTSDTYSFRAVCVVVWVEWEG